MNNKVTISKEVLDEMLELLRDADAIGCDIVRLGLHKNPDNIKNNTLIFAPELSKWSNELTEVFNNKFNNQ